MLLNENVARKIDQMPSETLELVGKKSAGNKSNEKIFFFDIRITEIGSKSHSTVFFCEQNRVMCVREVKFLLNS